MDRIIKFRGKDRGDKWHYGSLLTDNTDWACRRKGISQLRKEFCNCVKQNFAPPLSRRIY